MGTHGFGSIINSPHASWFEYLGLPEDLDGWTFIDVKESVTVLLRPADGTTPAPLMEPTQPSFSDYLSRIGEPYRFMIANRPRAESEQASEPVKAPNLKVPPSCFQADFDLSRAETFEHFSPSGHSAAVAMVTLEKLGGHLDAVELKLLAEVSTRADGFFTALKCYDDLMNEVATGRAQIEAMRKRLRSLEANLVDKSLELPVLVRRRANKGTPRMRV